MRENELHKQIYFEEQEYLHYVRHKHNKDNDNNNKQQ